MKKLSYFIILTTCLLVGSHCSVFSDETSYIEKATDEFIKYIGFDDFGITNEQEKQQAEEKAKQLELEKQQAEEKAKEIERERLRLQNEEDKRKAEQAMAMLSKDPKQGEGEQYSQLILIDQRATQRFLRRIFTAVRNVSLEDECQPLSCNECRLWGDIGGGKSFQKGEHKSKGYDASEFNFTLGIQRSMNDWLPDCQCVQFMPAKCLLGWTFGAAVSYEHESIDFKGGGHASMHNTQGALYALVTESWYYALLNVVAGYNSGKFESKEERVHSKPKLYQISGSYELGLNDLYVCSTYVQPFAAIETGYYHFSELKEDGLDHQNLKIKSKGTNITNSRLGVHLTRAEDFGGSWVFALDLAWNHLFSFKDHLKGHFHSAEEFDIRGPETGLNGFEGAFTVFKAINDHFETYGVVSGEKWENYSNWELRLGAALRW